MSSPIVVERLFRTIAGTAQTVGVAVVTIDRLNARNAVDKATADALFQAVVAIDADSSMHVGVLAGANGTFCAGADLRALDNSVGLQPSGAGPLGPTRFETKKPWIAAVSGYAVAGGLELALWCDLRVVESSAVLGVFCRRWGVPLIDGGTVRLPHLIGLSHALDIILTGRAVAADEALRIGLANRVVPDGMARDVAVDLAFGIASFPQRCMRNDRLAAIENAYGGAGAQQRMLRTEIDRGVDSLGSGEVTQGVDAFRSGAGRHGQFAKL
jgi:enoyl-CoA hydratase